MLTGQLLAFASVAMQSGGEVLYGGLLQGVPQPLFLLVAVGVMAGFCLLTSGFRAPSRGWGLLAIANVLTAVSFVSVFFALKHLPPAVYGAFQISTSLGAAVLLARRPGQSPPDRGRLLVCIGIIVGCALLAAAELETPMAHAQPLLVWAAIGASMLTGVTSTLTATASRALAARGWSSRAVLGHRFYATLLISCAWLAQERSAAPPPSGSSFALMAAIGVASLLAPLFVQQLALRRADTLSVMIALAAQPLAAFLLALLSPQYGWDSATFVGVCIVSFFVGLDVVLHRACERPITIQNGGKHAYAA